MTRPLAFSYFLIVMFGTACGSSTNLLPNREKRPSQVKQKQTVRLEYAASLEPYVDDKGLLVIPDQKLERWSGRTFIGSNSFDVVPVD